MNVLPHRLTGSAGLTYVAHLACTDAAPYRAAVAFLDAGDRWRGFSADTVHDDAETAYLDLMRTILTRIAAETPRSYVHFYPADAEFAERVRQQHYHQRPADPALRGEAWDYLSHAFATQACGCSLLGGRGLSTGTRAALAILRGEPDEPESPQAPADDTSGDADFPF